MANSIQYAKTVDVPSVKLITKLNLLVELRIALVA
jgi:hypothetical protein